MKLFQLNSREDFGREYYFSFLTIKDYSLFQLSVDYNDYSSYPFIQITSGMGKLFSILASVWRFGFCLELLARNWNWCYDPEVNLDDGFYET